MENLQELLPELEDIGASHEDLDLLNDVLGDTEYLALGEVITCWWSCMQVSFGDMFFVLSVLRQ